MYLKVCQTITKRWLVVFSPPKKISLLLIKYKADSKKLSVSIYYSDFSSSLVNLHILSQTFG